MKHHMLLDSGMLILCLPLKPVLLSIILTMVIFIWVCKSIINKTFLKMKEHIEISTEKAQKQDRDGTLAKKVHIYLARVKAKYK